MLCITAQKVLDYHGRPM